MNKLKSFIKIYILGTIAALVIWLLFISIRWKRNDFKKLKLDKPIIAVFWHGKQLMMAPLSMSLRKNNTGSFGIVKMLVSRHDDGRLIAWAVRFFGIRSIHGSTTRGGASALMKLKQSLSDGYSIAITPDGPKGPIHKVKRGAVYLGAHTDSPIIPISIDFSNYWTVNSWDKMQIPKPFCIGECKIGSPIYLSGTQLEEQLNKSAIQIAECLNTIK